MYTELHLIKDILVISSKIENHRVCPVNESQMNKGEI